MYLYEIARKIKAKTKKDLSDKQTQHFSVDSREIQTGSLFFALPGEKVDGHMFLEEAEEKGAIACVVEKTKIEKEGKIPYLYVDDPLEALQILAREKMRQLNPFVIGITGTVGKTTAKDYLKILLEEKYTITASKKSYNTRITLPLTILNDVRGDEDFVILEMSMTEKGNIEHIVQIAPPDIAAITKITLVHAKNFSPLENLALEEIALAKGEIFSHEKTFWGLIDISAPNLDEVKKIGKSEKAVFSKKGEKGEIVYFEQGTKVTLEMKEEKFCFDSSSFLAKHLVHNFMIAAILARKVGMSFEEIAKRIPFLTLPEKRFHFVEKNGVRFLNDSYNASEASVQVALEWVREKQVQGKKIAVLGSMMELGSFSILCHERVGYFALNCVDRIYCFGEECRSIVEVFQKNNKPAKFYLDKKEMMIDLKKEIFSGDLVLLKGSKSKAMWEILDEWE